MKLSFRERYLRQIRTAKHMARTTRKYEVRLRAQERVRVLERLKTELERVIPAWRDE